MRIVVSEIQAQLVLYEPPCSTYLKRLRFFGRQVAEGRSIVDDDASAGADSCIRGIALVSQGCVAHFCIRRAHLGKIDDFRKTDQLTKNGVGADRRVEKGDPALRIGQGRSPVITGRQVKIQGIVVCKAYTSEYRLELGMVLGQVGGCSRVDDRILKREYIGKI